MCLKLLIFNSRRAKSNQFYLTEVVGLPCKQHLGQEGGVFLAARSVLDGEDDACVWYYVCEHVVRFAVRGRFYSQSDAFS